MKKNYILATLLTGVYDVNRNEMLEINDFSIIEKWYQSLKKNALHGIIFHNTFSEKTVQQFQTEQIQFVRVAYDARFKPNVFRYWVYQDFLEKKAAQIENVFVTDSTDVEIVQNPFTQPLFLDNPDHLFCGDEAEILDNAWIHTHGIRLRERLEDYAAFEREYATATLLNCGIIGGSLNTMRELMQRIWHVHHAHSIGNDTASTLDMGAFNYVARRFFDTRLLHGAPINTVFKKYETERLDCWFRHK